MYLERKRQRALAAAKAAAERGFVRNDMLDNDDVAPLPQLPGYAAYHAAHLAPYNNPTHGHRYDDHPRFRGSNSVRDMLLNM